MATNSTPPSQPQWANGASIAVAVTSIASAVALLVALTALLTVECIAPQIRERYAGRGTPGIQSPQASPTSSSRQSLLQS